jgi:hypothetical protein
LRRNEYSSIEPTANASDPAEFFSQSQLSLEVIAASKKGAARDDSPFYLKMLPKTV